MEPSHLLPYATAGQPGCGGEMRRHPEDFLVEELPLYHPSGSGEHLYLLVEKTGLSTPEVVGHLCRELGLEPVQVGHAGLKDAASRSRQWLSLHVPGEPPLHQAETPNLRILATARHHNKLRPGHLLGNRFEITIRGAAPPAGFAELVQRVAVAGFPNFFGAQRLGTDRGNVTEGRRLVRGGFSRRLPRNRARFYTNAYQAALFNDLVAHRLEALGTLEQVFGGDLATRRESNGFFLVAAADLAEAQTRARVGEISATAPLFGYKVPLAEGVPGEWERAVLVREGLTLARFQAPRKGLAPAGERRGVRAYPQHLAWHPVSGEPDGLRLQFTLGPGEYATSLLRELMKNDETLSCQPIGAALAAGKATHAP